MWQVWIMKVEEEGEVWMGTGMGMGWCVERPSRRSHLAVAGWDQINYRYLKFDSVDNISQRFQIQWTASTLHLLNFLLGFPLHRKHPVHLSVILSRAQLPTAIANRGCPAVSGLLSASVVSALGRLPPHNGFPGTGGPK
jgi:hypothetical protein